MPIPGLKVLDDILVGLPDNARLRREVEQLKEQIAALERENDDLKKQLAKAAPKSGLSPESLQILQFLFKRSGQHFAAQQFAGILEVELGVAEYHCEKLFEQKLINRHRRALQMGAVQYPDEYSLSPSGRAHLVENGLTG